MSSKLSLESQFMRECNRIRESDRVTKRRGLQTLLDSLPWESKKSSERQELIVFLHAHVVPQLLISLSDSVEKCRELTLKILQRTTQLWAKSDVFTHDDLLLWAQRLCERVNEVPFAESAEELRLQVLEVLREVIAKEVKVYKKSISHGASGVAPDAQEPSQASLVIPTISEQARQAFASNVLLSMTKSLTDNFPSVKRICAELISLMSKFFVKSVRTHATVLCKALLLNLSHQHSKTRQMTLQAIGHVLQTVSFGTYRSLLLDDSKPSPSFASNTNATAQSIASSSSSASAMMMMAMSMSNHSAAQSLLLQCWQQHLLSDRTPTVRMELATTIRLLLQKRIKEVEKQRFVHGRVQERLQDVDFELIALLLYLCGEDNESVSSLALQSLREAVQGFTPYHAQAMESSPSQCEDVFVENGELEMRRIQIEFDGESASSGAAADSGMDIEQTTADAVNTTVVDADESAMDTTADADEHESINNNNDNKGNTGIEESVTIDRVKSFLSAYVLEINAIVARDVDQSWTSESKSRALRGLARFLQLLQENSECLTQCILLLLSQAIRESDSVVRESAEWASRVLGEVVACDVWMTQAMTRLHVNDRVESAANVNGLLRVVTQCLRGLETRNRSRSLEQTVEALLGRGLAVQVSALAEKESMFLMAQSRDAAVREALLLLVRAVIDVFLASPPVIDATERSQCELSLVLTLLRLSVRLANESETVSIAARRELLRIATLSVSGSLSSPKNTEVENAVETVEDDTLVANLLATYFVLLLGRILFPNDSRSKTISILNENLVHEEWTAETLHSFMVVEHHLPLWNGPQDCEQEGSVACFALLLRLCPAKAWKHFPTILPAIAVYTMPPKPLADGSAEQNMKSYAAVRGEEEIDGDALINTRLRLLSLTEELIRIGSGHWQTAQLISLCAEALFRDILADNLIWRVGRVEATTRKVALTGVYALLKTGALGMEILFKIATQVVPLLVSQLDDSEVTPRLLSSLSLALIFHRLRGVFSEQSIREMYPKLIARLDDSNDDVRIAMCDTLSPFLLCGVNKQCYSGTMIDYVLDQLFIHLDDPLPAVQDAVLRTIITASQVDKDLVLKKAESNRLSHRSPVLCDRVTNEVQGYEILS